MNYFSNLHVYASVRVQVLKQDILCDDNLLQTSRVITNIHSLYSSTQ